MILVILALLSISVCSASTSSRIYYVVYTKGQVQLKKGIKTWLSSKTYLGGDSVTGKDTLILAKNSEVELQGPNGKAFVIDSVGKWTFDLLSKKEQQEKQGILETLYHVMSDGEEEYSNKYMPEYGGVSRGRVQCPYRFYPLNGQSVKNDSIDFYWNKCAGLHQYELYIFADSISSIPVLKLSTKDTFVHLSLKSINPGKGSVTYYWNLKDPGANYSGPTMLLTVMGDSAYSTSRAIGERLESSASPQIITSLLIKSAWLEDQGLYAESKMTFEALLKEYPDDHNLLEVFKLFKLRVGYE